MNERRFYFIIALLVILAITLPYLYAVRAGGSEYVFGGFLINARDGNSYLAKMRQGWEGAWRFRLTYSPDPGEGVWFIYIFYLGLGHLARVLNVPLLLMFHLARLAGAVCLLWALTRLWRSLFLSPHHRKLAFAISALSSGLGWLGLPFGAFTSDLWVAETYPFLSTYTNPHFACSLALLVFLLVPKAPKSPKNTSQRAKKWSGFLWPFLGSFALSLMAPFGVVIVLLTKAVLLILKTVETRSEFWQKLVESEGFWSIVVIALGGLPVPIYELWAIHADPVYRAWNDQNLTPAPPLWDVFIALSPALVMSILGLRLAWKKDDRFRVLAVWAGTSLILLYVPWKLQRRFMMGLFIPLAGLTVLGIDWLKKRINIHYRTLVILFFVLSLPTNLILIFSGLHAAQTHAPNVYLSADEVQAFAWIEENVPPDALILTGPETGLYIPPHTGRRVLYGHPYETANAEAAKSTVTAFFTGETASAQAESLLRTRNIDYIFRGPREKELGQLPALSTLTPIFSNNTVHIYEMMP
ncbi:MAG: hypothetical protein MAG431_02391 [Chloroflexi bacterium]|nr:hypothetical protein [Chloroflexota bacterium]